MNKDIFKQLIVLHQSHIPFSLKEREEHLPLHAEQIITIPGVRRSGKSSKMKLVINDLVKSGGADPRQTTARQIATDLLQCHAV